MENLKYRVIYEYEFHRGTSAAEMAPPIPNTNFIFNDLIKECGPSTKSIALKSKKLSPIFYIFGFSTLLKSHDLILSFKPFAIIGIDICIGF
jgi:hypothetical protein